MAKVSSQMNFVLRLNFLLMGQHLVKAYAAQGCRDSLFSSVAQKKMVQAVGHFRLITLYGL